MSGYMTFWSKEHIRDMKKAGDIGPLTVIYGGRHSKEPSLKKIKVGDVIFPVSLENNKLIVMARLQVERLEDAFEYQLREIGYPCGAIIPEGTLVISDGPFTEKEGRFVEFSNGCGYMSKITIPDNITRKIDMNTLTHRECAYHKFPITCCSEIAAIGRGTTIKGRAIPDDKIPMLLFGNTKSTLKLLQEASVSWKTSCTKIHASHVLRQDLRKEIRAGHFQNQKQLTCISRIQSKSDFDVNPSQYHSLADDKFDCICSHECLFQGSYRFVSFVPEQKYRQEFHHQLKKDLLRISDFEQQNSVKRRC